MNTTTRSNQVDNEDSRHSPDHVEASDRSAPSQSVHEEVGSVNVQESMEAREAGSVKDGNLVKRHSVSEMLSQGKDTKAAPPKNKEMLLDGGIEELEEILKVKEELEKKVIMERLELKKAGLVSFDEPYEKALPKVLVCVHGGENLAKENTFVRVSFGECPLDAHTTKAAKGTPEPRWEQQFVATLQKCASPWLCTVECYTQAKPVPHMIGKFQIDLVADLGLKQKDDQKSRKYFLDTQGKVEITFRALTNLDFPGIELDRIGSNLLSKLPVVDRPCVMMTIYQIVGLTGPAKSSPPKVFLSGEMINYNHNYSKILRVNPIHQTEKRSNTWNPFYNTSFLIPFETKCDIFKVSLHIKTKKWDTYSIASFSVDIMMQLATATVSKKWFPINEGKVSGFVGLGIKSIHHHSSLAQLPVPPTKGSRRWLKAISDKNALPPTLSDLALGDTQPLVMPFSQPSACPLSPPSLAKQDKIEEVTSEVANDALSDSSLFSPNIKSLPSVPRLRTNFSSSFGLPDCPQSPLSENQSSTSSSLPSRECTIASPHLPAISEAKPESTFTSKPSLPPSISLGELVGSIDCGKSEIENELPSASNKRRKSKKAKNSFGQVPSENSSSSLVDISNSKPARRRSESKKRLSRSNSKECLPREGSLGKLPDGVPEKKLLRGSSKAAVAPEGVEPGAEKKLKRGSSKAAGIAIPLKELIPPLEDDDTKLKPSARSRRNSLRQLSPREALSSAEALFDILKSKLTKINENNSAIEEAKFLTSETSVTDFEKYCKSPKSNDESAERKGPSRKSSSRALGGEVAGEKVVSFAPFSEVNMNVPMVFTRKATTQLPNSALSSSCIAVDGLGEEGLALGGENKGEGCEYGSPGERACERTPSGEEKRAQMVLECIEKLKNTSGFENVEGYFGPPTCFSCSVMMQNTEKVLLLKKQTLCVPCYSMVVNVSKKKGILQAILAENY